MNKIFYVIFFIIHIFIYYKAFHNECIQKVDEYYNPDVVPVDAEDALPLGEAVLVGEAVPVDTDENIPDHLKDHSLYVAFAPIDDPQIVVATVIENVGSGSKFAAPISNKIINYYLDKVRERY